MIQVSEELKNAFNNGNQKDLTLTFSDHITLTNENIVAESMSIEQILCDEEQLRFGLCGSTSFKIRIVNSNTPRVGLTVVPTITAHANGNDYPMQLGVFKIVEDNVTDDRLYRDIVAYDSLYEILNNDYASWYASLNFPMNLRTFRDLFFSHVGLTQVATVLPNDNMFVYKTVAADTFTGSQVIQTICELGACFGFIDNQNRFKYTKFTTEGALYPKNDLYPENYIYPNGGSVIVDGTINSYISGTFVYEDYAVQDITGLAIVENEDDTSYLYGTDYNLYKITNNYLLFGKNASDLERVANDFLDAVDGFMYRPSRVKMRAMPWVEPGDIVEVRGKKNNAVFPVLKRTMEGITGLYDTYEARGRKFYEFSANTTKNLFEKLKSRTMKLERTVDGFYQEYQQFERDTEGNFTSQSTRISQNAETISTEATRASTAEGSLSSRITQNAEQIELRVEKNGVVSAINQTSETVKIQANKIDLSGYVTISSLSTSGSTNINGDNITTGTINANRISTNGLVVHTVEMQEATNAIRMNFDDPSIAIGSPTTLSVATPYLKPTSSGNVLECQLLNGYISYGWNQVATATFHDVMNIASPQDGIHFTSPDCSVFFQDNNGAGRAVHGDTDSHTYAIGINSGGEPYLMVDGRQLGRFTLY